MPQQHQFGLGRMASARLDARLSQLRQDYETENSYPSYQTPTHVPRKKQRQTGTIFGRMMGFIKGTFSGTTGTSYERVQHSFSKIQDETWEVVNVDDDDNRKKTLINVVVDDDAWEIIDMGEYGGNFTLNHQLVVQLLEQAADEVTAGLSIPSPPNYLV